MKLLHVCLAAFVLTLLSTPATHAAVTLVLRLEGIAGESTVPGHQSEIDIGEVSFSVEQAVALKEAGKGGASAGKAAFTPVTISKGADKASPMLFLNSVLGRPIKNAKISFLAPDDGGTNLVEFFSISLANVIISKFSISAASGDNNTQEVVTLNYGMILVNYTPAIGTPIAAGFDVIKNKEIMSLPGITN